jgi:hypothetical protein
MVSLRWQGGSRSEDRTVVTEEELVRLLTELEATAQGHPVMACLVSNRGDVLGVGLGLPRSVLTFTSSSGQPPYWISVGAGPKDATFAFDYFGSESEYLSGNSVSLEDAHAAAADFYRTGRRPRGISWEET